MSNGDNATHGHGHILPLLLGPRTPWTEQRSDFLRSTTEEAGVSDINGERLFCAFDRLGYVQIVLPCFPTLQRHLSNTSYLCIGIHIIEGPNIPILLWIATAVVALSFIVSLTYDIVLHDKDSGFAIGQWMLAVLSVGTAAGVVHVADLA